MKDLTQGNPVKIIIFFAVPIILGNLIQQIYNLSDTIIVGHFVGAGALAALGSTGFLYFLIVGFVSGMSAGFCIPLARCFGARDMHGVRSHLINMIYLSSSLVIIITVAVLISVRSVLQIMNTPPDIFESAFDYIFTISAGLGATVLYNMLANISRALGDSKTPLYFLIVAAVLNISLDLLFVARLGMGTFGAAFATVLAQICAGAACFIYIRRKFGELYVESYKPDFKIMINLLTVGLPMALQFSITAVGGLVLQTDINTLGTLAVTAITVAGKVQMILTQPFEALGQTIATYSSQNLGAGKLRRVSAGVRASLLMTLVISAFGFLIIAVGGVNLGRIFINADEFNIVHSNMQTYLFIGSLCYSALGVLLILRNAIQGLGYTLPAMIAGVFEMIARATVGMIIVREWGFFGACLGNPSAWLAANILLVPVYFLVMRSLRRKIPENLEV